MKNKKIIILLTVIVVLFVGGGLLYSTLSENNGIGNGSTTTAREVSDAAATTIAITASTASVPSEGIDVGDLASDFTLKNYEGEDVSLSDYRGKIVILNFWASWCGPCKNEMPNIQAIQDEITAAGSDADTVILSVNLTDGQRETKDTAYGFMTANGYTSTLVFDDGSASTLYQIYFIPETFILNKEGIIIKVITGAAELDTLNAAVEEARG